jgi:uncharacterized membrane protein YdbT with pleckstrin-like domain
VTSDQQHFEILTRRVAHYFRLRSLPILFVLILSLFPFIAPLVDGFDTLAFVTFAPFCLSYILYAVYFFWLAGKQAAALKYWIQDSTIRIDEGIFLRKRKSIPLDRITDIVLIQGPIMRFFGIWWLHLQTAGSNNQQGPEGVLQGVLDPEAVRDFIMEARDRIVGVTNQHSES